MPKYVIEREIHGADKLMSYQLKGLYPTLWAIVLLLVLASCSKDEEPPKPDISNPEPEEETSLLDSLTIETFTFSSNGEDIEGKIYLPDAYETNNDLPAIFLIDYMEQHFAFAADEFEQVIRGVLQIEDFEALVVTLENIPNYDAKPLTFIKHFEVFRDMTIYVNGKYTNNTSRTFIGKGSEAGVVLQTLLNEDPEANIFDNYIATDSPASFNNVVINLNQNNSVLENMLNKKLHFSFSTSNNQTNCLALINSFQEAQYPWLKFQWVEYTNSDYENTYPTSFGDGLEFVYKQ
jgi:hypothetical protein